MEGLSRDAHCCRPQCQLAVNWTDFWASEELYPCDFCPAVWHAACAGQSGTWLQRSDPAGWRCPACVRPEGVDASTWRLREEREREAHEARSSTGEAAGAAMLLPATTTTTTTTAAANQVLETTRIDSRSCPTIIVLSDDDDDEEEEEEEDERQRRERCRAMEQTAVEQAQARRRQGSTAGLLAETNGRGDSHVAVAAWFQKRQHQSFLRDDARRQQQSEGDPKRHKAAHLSSSFQSERPGERGWRGAEAAQTADRTPAQPNPPPQRSHAHHAPAACRDAERADVSHTSSSYGEQTVVDDRLPGQRGVTAGAAEMAGTATTTASTARALAMPVGGQEVHGGDGMRVAARTSTSSTASDSVSRGSGSAAPRASVSSLLAGLQAQATAHRLASTSHPQPQQTPRNQKSRGEGSSVVATSLPMSYRRMEMAPRGDAGTPGQHRQQSSVPSVSRALALPSPGAMRVAAELREQREREQQRQRQQQLVLVYRRHAQGAMASASAVRARHEHGASVGGDEQTTVTAVAQQQQQQQVQSTITPTRVSAT